MRRFMTVEEAIALIKKEPNTYSPKWNPKVPIIVGLIHTLYDLDGCSTGGLCHIVTDDDNIKDEDLWFVINHSKMPENKDCLDKELSSWICELMLQLDLEQRAGLFGLMNEDFHEIDESVWQMIPDLPGVQMFIEDHVKDEGYFETEGNK